MSSEAVHFDYVQELINNQKANIENLLMTSQVGCQKQPDVIVKPCKRMPSQAEAIA